MLALILVLIAGQALAAVSAPAGGVAATGRVMGATGFAYLGGLRTFTAAILWTRLEPLFHGYYGGKHVKELKEFLPTMRLVQTLDPQFEQAYYNAAWIVAQRGNMEEALAIAREGVKNNPNSGLLRANYVQLLIIDDKVANLDEAYENAVFGLSSKAQWATIDDQFEGYAIFRTVFTLRGDDSTADKINEVLERMRLDGAQPGQDDERVIPGGE